MTRRCYRTRNFRLLRGSQFVGDLGGYFSGIALPATLILALQATPLQIGALDAISTGMIPLCAGAAGVLADRGRRRPVLIVTNVVRLIALLVIALAFAAHCTSFWLCFGVAATIAAASTVFDAAYAAFLPAVVGEANIGAGTAALALGSSVAEAVGNGVAGCVVMLAGAPFAILINVATFAASTVALAALDVSEAPGRGPSGRGGVGRDVRDGIAAIVAHPILCRVTVSNAVAHFGGGMAAAVATVYMYRGLHLTPLVLGLVIGAANVGALAAWYADRIAERFGMRHAMAGAHLVSACGKAALPLLAGMFPLVAVAVSRTLLTASGPVFAVNDATLRLSLVPDVLRGRATATARAIVWTALPAGSLAGGFLGEHIGLSATMLAGAAATACAALIVPPRTPAVTLRWPAYC